MPLSLTPERPHPGFVFLDQGAPPQLEVLHAVPLDRLLLHLHTWVTPLIRKSAVALCASIHDQWGAAIHSDLRSMGVQQDKPTTAPQVSLSSGPRIPGVLVLSPGPSHSTVTALSKWLKECEPVAGDVLRLLVLKSTLDHLTSVQNAAQVLGELHLQLTPAPPQGAPLLRQLGLPRANPFSAA